jgi:cysteine desulfurase
MAPSSADYIYLDHNATTPAFPEVVEAMRACWSEPCLNPASQHEFGRRARRVLEDARERIAELLGAKTSGTNADRVIFTSGGTEANNLALHGLLEQAEAPPSPPPYVIISPIEHPSITNVANFLSQRGCRVDRLGVNRDGVIRVDDLEDALTPETGVVAVMVANNETGVIQPVAQLAAICNKHQIPLHADAAQAAGKLPLDFRRLGAATMSIAPHKFGGPLGIGALFVRSDIQLSPMFHGGTQQAGLRPGTEPVALVVGMKVALELWHNHRREWTSRLESLRDRFENAIRSAESIQSNGCQVVVLGEGADRLANTSNVSFVGLDRQQLFLALDQAGVACSAGSACASGSSEPSFVHVAMGCEPGVIGGALRFSFGLQTTAGEVDDAVRRITQICNILRRQKQA